MRILVTSPNYDVTTTYLSAWFKCLIGKFDNRHEVFILDGDRANKKRVCGMLESRNIELVLLNGHGADDKIAGQDNEILISLDNVNVLDGKTVHALSCATAKELGPAAIEAGAKSYIGYDENFIFFNQGKLSNPTEDKYARLFFEPAIAVPKALVDGKTADEAVEAGIKFYKRNLAKALTSTDVQENYQDVAWALWFDMKHLKKC